MSSRGTRFNLLQRQILMSVERQGSMEGISVGRWGVSFDEEGAKLTLKWGCADCVLSYQCPSLSQLTWLQWGARLICLPDAPLPREDTGPRLWGWLSGTVGSRQSDCPSSEHLGAAGLPLLACGGQSCPGMTQGARGTCPSWRCSHGCLESMIWASGPIKDVHRSTCCSGFHSFQLSWKVSGQCSG